MNTLLVHCHSLGEVSWGAILSTVPLGDTIPLRPSLDSLPFTGRSWNGHFSTWRRAQSSPCAPASLIQPPRLSAPNIAVAALVTSLTARSTDCPWTGYWATSIGFSLKSTRSASDSSLVRTGSDMGNFLPAQFQWMRSRRQLAERSRSLKPCQQVAHLGPQIRPAVGRSTRLHWWTGLQPAHDREYVEYIVGVYYPTWFAYKLRNNWVQGRVGKVPVWWCKMHQ